jgi:hypothetical protein
MKLKVFRSKEITAELPLDRSNRARYVLMERDDANGLSPNFEIFRDSVYPVDTAEDAAADSSRLHQELKFILQDCQTHKYMRCDSMWTDDINEALDFLSARRVVLFGLKELKAAFNVLKFGCMGLEATATVGVGLLKWSKAPRTAHFTPEVAKQNNTPKNRRMQQLVRMLPTMPLAGPPEINRLNVCSPIPSSLCDENLQSQIWCA